MEQPGLKHAFKAMMYVAKQEGVEDLLEEKWFQLDEWLVEYERDEWTDVAAMVDNIELFYQTIDTSEYERLAQEERKEDEDEGQQVETHSLVGQRTDEYKEQESSDVNISYVIQDRETHDILMVTTNRENALAEVYEGRSVVITGMPLTP